MIKKFSPYNLSSNSNFSEINNAIEFAKKRNDEYLASLKQSSEFLEKEKIKELNKKREELLKEEEMKRVNSISNEIIQNNLNKANENNKKFAPVFDSSSSTEDLINSLFEKNN